ncbi:GldG family protein [Vacuolonema iberomarrocanum]|uniref:GldG family protein n=1 Tax=Vacuolonema iberomarrocanum TaxID=3454632 RepID=UPI0019E26465|nr:Gldg family protein [filamentous cyanobacterium LEGE 07170]
MKTWQRYTNYLFWFGPFLLAMGLTVGGVSGTWGILPFALILGGIVIVLAWLAIQSNELRNVWSDRSAQDGTNAVIATLAVLIIVVLINLLADRYNTSVDLTENQIFTLSPQTREVVEGLQEPVEVYLFDPLPNPRDEELLNDYEELNPDNFTYRYIDPQAEPGVTQQFGVRRLGEVYVEQGEQRQLVQTVSPDLRLTEPRLTNALVQLTSDRQITIYFVQGHGERLLQEGEGGLAEAVQNLQNENLVVEPLNLANSPEVPEDADVVVLAGPQRPLLDEELTALETYMQGESGLLLLLDPLNEPELDEFLADWGVEVSDRVLFEPAAGNDGIITFITQYGQHPITQELLNGISFYPLSRPLQLTETDEVQALPLLVTSAQTQAREIGDDGTLLPPGDNDPEGNFVLGAVLSRPAEVEDAPDTTEEAPDAEATTGDAEEETSEAEENPETPAETSEADAETPEATALPPEARMVVIGNSSFITDGIISQQLNRDVFLNAINWLSQDETASLAIRAAEPTNRRILLSPIQQIGLAIAAMGLLPALGLGLAIASWWRRR